MKKIIPVLIAALLISACTLPKRKSSVTDVAHPTVGALAVVTPVAVKDFETKGVIFVTSEIVYDINGDKNGSEITYEMLMREAVKLGADDVINVRIDQHDVIANQDYYKLNTLTNAEEYSYRESYPKKTIYTATGLAIKYTDAIVPPCPMGGAQNAAKVEMKSAAPVEQPVAPAVAEEQAPAAVTAKTAAKASKSVLKHSVFSRK